MVITSKNGANALENAAIFEAQLESLLDCLYISQSDIIAAIMSEKFLNLIKACCSGSGSELRTSCRTASNREEASSSCGVGSILVCARDRIGDSNSACIWPGGSVEGTSRPKRIVKAKHQLPNGALGIFDPIHVYLL